MKTPIKPTWHYWHETLLAIGRLSTGARRQEIRWNKPDEERTRRLRLFKTVRGTLPRDVLTVLQREAGSGISTDSALRGLPKASCDAIQHLHKKECPRCPWNGHTIFPRRRRRTQ